MKLNLSTAAAPESDVARLLRLQKEAAAVATVVIETVKATVSESASEPVSATPPLSDGAKVSEIPESMRSDVETKLGLLSLKTWDADVTKEAEAFIQNLESLKESFDKPDIIGQQLRSIMTDLANNPEFEEFLAPEDGNTMVRGLRSSYGIAVAVKAARKKGPKKSKTSVSADTQASIDEIAAMMIE